MTFNEAPAPPPTPAPLFTRTDSARYDLSNLPTPHSDDLIGRDQELAMLTDEWANRATRNITALIAEGGTGKSFLVSTWLAQLKDRDPKPYAGARRIFTWSFYSQGSKGQVTSSEAFFTALLRAFDVDDSEMDSLTRADEALKCVCQHDMLLVLDGVEPLQNPPGHADAGRFYDTTLGDFIKRLAGQDWPGLVLITSRQRLVDLRPYEGTAVHHEDLNALSIADGAALLTRLHVTGPEDEKRQAAHEMRGHAFGLVLLARYLTDILDNPDIRQRDQAKLLDDDVPGADKAKRMLQAYADHFGADSALTALLHLLGLFDRPVPRDALIKVLEDPAIPDLTEPFHGARPARLNPMLRRLEEIKLITRPKDEEKPDEEEVIDGHPLVREHFGAVLRGDRPEAWKQAHSRLYDYFTGQPEKDLPNTPEELMPLYQSLHHGVAAGRAQQALDEAYLRRVNRGSENYGSAKLGLFGTELAALAAFFPGGWQDSVAEVTPDGQGFLLNKAAFRLRALGRLQEARVPMERSIEVDKEHDDDLNAAGNSSSLSEFLVLTGDLSAAERASDDAVALADKAEDEFSQMAYRAQRVHVLAMRGQREQALDLFKQAEDRQSKLGQEFLYSLPGFNYASFLIDTATSGNLPALTHRVETTLGWVTAQDWLLDIALDELNLARIAALLGQDAAPAFDTAITALRKAGQRDETPKGYLARATYRRTQKDLDGAWADLAEARAIAEPSGMRLYLCDALIEEAWLHHLAGDAEPARLAFQTAQSEVNAMGYHWRDPDLDRLRAELGL